MAGIIVTDGNIYIGEHKCPMDERERSTRQAFYDLQVSHNAPKLITVDIVRESCYDFAVRMNTLAKKVALTTLHPAVRMAYGGYNHLNEEDTKRFDSEEISWFPY